MCPNQSLKRFDGLSCSLRIRSPFHDDVVVVGSAAEDDRAEFEKPGDAPCALSSDARTGRAIDVRAHCAVKSKGDTHAAPPRRRVGSSWAARSFLVGARLARSKCRPYAPVSNGPRGSRAQGAPHKSRLRAPNETRNESQTKPETRPEASAMAKTDRTRRTRADRVHRHPAGRAHMAWRVASRSHPPQSERGGKREGKREGKEKEGSEKER